MLDARKAFGDAWYRARCGEHKATAVVRLYENGEMKEERTNARAAAQAAQVASDKAATAAAKAEAKAAVAAEKAAKKKEEKEKASLEALPAKKAKAESKSDEAASPRGKKGKAVFVDSEGREVENNRSAYQLFCNDKRAEVKAAVEAELATPADADAAAGAAGHKSVFGETTKRLSALWAACSDEEKATFTAAAAADKQRYEAAIASNAEHNAAVAAAAKDARSSEKRKSGDGDGEKKAKAAKLVDGDGNEIKKPLSAFFHFSAEQRTAVAAEASEAAVAGGKKGVAQVATRLGELWASLEDKAPYEAMAAADKERYDAAVGSNPNNAWVADAAAKKAADKAAAAARAVAKAEAKEAKEAKGGKHAAKTSDDQRTIDALFKPAAAVEAAVTATVEASAQPE